ncbi:MAG: hypothetical protein WDN04_18635 [Rhodospirillales bacterium]
MSSLDVQDRPTPANDADAVVSIFDYPGPQKTFEAERLFRKQRLAASFRLFARYASIRVSPAT